MGLTRSYRAFFMFIARFLDGRGLRAILVVIARGFARCVQLVIFASWSCGGRYAYVKIGCRVTGSFLYVFIVIARL